jgi:hypothetical protein
MYYLFIPISISILFSIFLFFKGKDIKYIIKNNDTKESEELYSKILSLQKHQIDFLYKTSRQNLDDTFALRDNENKAILSHTTIFVAASTFFYFLSKWTYHHHDKTVLFIILSIMLTFAFISLTVSVIAMFRAFTLNYELPPEAKNLVNLSSNYNVTQLKSMLIDRWTNGAAVNYPSNVRKMKLMTLTREYLFYAFSILLAVFIIIILCKYVGIIAPSLML